MSLPVTAWSLIGTLTSAAVALAAFARSEQVYRRRQDAAVTAIDAAAYQRAREIYDSAIDALQEQNRALTGQVAQLTGRVVLLERVMRKQGMEVPPETA